MQIVKPIPLNFKFPSAKRIGIYCRVSSKHEEQLASLAHQVSYLTKIVMNKPNWWLEDIYIDIKSGETASARTEFNRLLQDCRNGNLELVITKNISRFGRDTLEMLESIRALRELNVAVLFDDEMISALDPDSELITTIIGAYAQAMSESRSSDTQRGLVMRAKDGTSGLYKRRCFGYSTNKNGELEINDEEAEVVRSIFDMYLRGESLVGIIRNLKSKGIKTATGKDSWSKNTLDKLLSNEKYCGDVVLFKSYSTLEMSPIKRKKRKENNGEVSQYMCVYIKPSCNYFERNIRVRPSGKTRRSNVEITIDGAKRKSVRYSKKRDAPF